MAFVLEDRVVETANNPGQGDFELLGAVENNQTFVTGIGNGNTTRYLAIGAEDAEIGVAQVQAGSPDRLLRPGTVKNLDGTNSPINFSGTVTVACIASVEDVLWLNENGDLPARGARDLGADGDRWRNLYLSGNARFNQARAEGNTGHYRSSGRYLDLDPGGDEDALVRIFRHTAAGLSGYGLSLYAGASGAWLTLSKGEGIDLLEGIYSGDGSGLTNLPAESVSPGTLHSGVQIATPAGAVPIVGVRTSAASTQSIFPLGHLVLVVGPAGFSRNANIVPRVHETNSNLYTLEGSGTPLSGVWVSRGRAGTSNDAFYLAQRVS